MHTEKYNVLVTAEQPIVHSEGIFGNIATFRRQKVCLRDGSTIRLPLVSGNSMRNGLRRAVMWHAINLLGNPKIGKKAINLLFSGGSLDSSASSIDVSGYREMMALFPPLGLFGGGTGNALIPGCLQVGPLVPICEETTSIAMCPVPSEVIPDGFVPKPISTYLDTHMGTRRELFSDPKFKKMLASGEEAQVEKRLLDNKEKKKDGKPTDKGDSQQMIYEFEALAQGTLFYWSVGIQLATDLERDCFLTTVALYSRNASVAAKGAVGFGKISMQAKGIQTITPTVESKLPSLHVAQTYEKHIKDHSKEINDWLGGMG